MRLRRCTMVIVDPSHVCQLTIVGMHVLQLHACIHV